MRIKNINEVILCISDMHIPYQHPDTFEFLKAVKKKYKPTRIVCLGDEVDKHAMSFHPSDADLPSAGDELKQAIAQLESLYKIFPVMDLIDSNHGSMAFRKAKFHGIPMKYIRSYNDVLEAPSGWNWHSTLKIQLPNKQTVYFCHGIKKDGLKLAEQMGVNVVQGHYHTEFNIQYSSSPSQLIWSMQVGCSIDDKSLAFAYNKNHSS
jgi:predicted phosphodiesterase